MSTENLETGSREITEASATPVAPVPTETEALVEATGNTGGAPKDHTKLIASIIVGLLIVAGAGYYVYSNNYAGGGVVAVVDGTKIYHDELTETISIMKQSPATYGIAPASPTADAELSTQALDLLITNVLLVNAAKAGEFEVTDEAVESTYQELIAIVGGEEALKSQMATVGLTDTKLRSNIKERELIDQYLKSATDIENIVITDAEVEEVIKTLTENNIELPPIEEFAPQVRSQLTSEKQTEIIATLIEKLRSEATIEKRI